MPVNAEISPGVRTSTDALPGPNIRYTGLEWQPRHHAEYYVYLFNVSQRKFEKVGPYQNVTIPGVTEEDPFLKGMQANERYHFVTSFPQPMMMPRFSDQSSEIGVVHVDARRYVMDIINPNNVTLSLDTVIPPEHQFSINNDLSIKGVFFSLSNPPAKEDVKKAIGKMEAYYKNLLERAQTLELTDKAKLSEELGQNPDYAYAATYFGKELSWNKRQVRPVQCPNCGEMKPFGAKFHVNKELGFVCIEPTKEGWKAACQAGVKRREDIPEGLGLEYWLDDEPPQHGKKGQ